MRAKIMLWSSAALWAGFAASTATGQERAWIQVEAQPTLGEAQARADAYDDAFPMVQGYSLGSRWFGIALGPYNRDEAIALIQELRAENLIPSDSYLTDGQNFREQFWPIDGAASGINPPPVMPERPAEAEATPVAPPEEITQGPLNGSQNPAGAQTPTAPAPADQESPEQARSSEAALDLQGRQDLQRALQWAGFYASGIDGAFGPGTRNSMAEWQGAMGFAQTGILTSQQRQVLLEGWQADIAAFGFETVNEAEAGIEITLPMALIEFDHYEPPFVHYRPKTPGGLKVVLISQPGERGALYGLYDNLLDLTMFPADGPRNRGERDFTISAQGTDVVSHAFAETRQGLVKGYILSWSPQNAEAAKAAPRVLQQMQASFRAQGARALDPGMVPISAAGKSGLMAGLELRKPKQSLSGFYVTQSGAVLTAAAPLAQCGKITIDGRTQASLKPLDHGLALLTPNVALSPEAFANFQLQPERVGAEITVAGYSYGAALPAPALTFGQLEALSGLNGEAELSRLAVATLAGDAGGPVLDATGAVIGMLQPPATQATRQLPDGVAFALSTSAIAPALQAGGVVPAQATAQGALAPEDLARKARGMTVLVDCWE